MAHDESNPAIEGPASVARMLIEAQNDLSPEQRDYMEKMEAYLEGPGHDQSA